MKHKIGKFQLAWLSWCDKDLAYYIERGRPVNIGLCEYVRTLFFGTLFKIVPAFSFILLLLSALLTITGSFIAFLTFPLYADFVGVGKIMTFLLELGFSSTLTFLVCTPLVGIGIYISTRADYDRFYFWPKPVRDKLDVFFNKRTEKVVFEEKEPSIIIEYFKAVKNKFCPVITLERKE